MQIELSDERQTEFKEQLKALFLTEFEVDLSDFRADAVLGLFLKTLGPAVYNQAVQDVRAHLQVRLDDLEGEVYADD
ncbi:DUF2164 domain-containing protein [Pelagibius sp.]|uniref:DUF2164 domain-containing protein n=1 Tax=Pelagibius sp. TaxID=1931238 RepID=UPI003BAF7EE9